MIAEIERGQMYFENDEIAAEYGAALKRQRIRRLAAMPFFTALLARGASGKRNNG